MDVGETPREGVVNNERALVGSGAVSRRGSELGHDGMTSRLSHILVL